MAVTPDAHGADPESVDNPEAHVPLAARAGRAMQIGAASVSLALMVGVGVWGYRLMVRDATGIPVVRAMQGPLRERPEAPGGEVALNVGLAVNAVAAQGGAAPTEHTSAIAVRAEAFPLGTTLVQLGAYPDEGAATAAWTRISSDFSDFIAGREPVIQAAESAGQTFYRLRAIGFEDLADARRFCSALVAEEADCIPVVVR
ncbi:SPOR domain-containing protein [Wenxinia marina]|uniref:Sporulation related domain protein n=1 Tax=Wenxinia marina DSM 24838 TaxID=1123501 RepID=A0A0D0NHN2_9RHOB|nr:SPOR domain-containing protein [Wenxinia marina]KIQ67855.1 Sporulation related domain protein [Wenxinia marina DSM 24838]